MQRLWIFAASNRVDGVLSGLTEEDIELAASWPGDEGVLVSTLLDVRFLDQEEGVYVLHGWAKRNPWASRAEERGDRARMSRLARENRSAYESLKEHGIDGISQGEYVDLTSPQRSNNDRTTTVQRIITNRSTPFLSSPLLSSPAQIAKEECPDGHSSAGDQPQAQDGEAKGGEKDPPKPPGRQQCPYQAIVEIYHDKCQMLPRIRDITDPLKKRINARWSERVERRSIAWWESFFEKDVAGSDYLSGRVKEWRADLFWLTGPENMTKVLNGTYRNKPGTALSRAGTKTAEAARQFVGGAS